MPWLHTVQKPALKNRRSEKHPWGRVDGSIVQRFMIKNGTESNLGLLTLKHAVHSWLRGWGKCCSAVAQWIKALVGVAWLKQLLMCVTGYLLTKQPNFRKYKSWTQSPHNNAEHLIMIMIYNG